VAEAVQSPAQIRVRGRRSLLRPLDPSDYPALYEAEFSPELIATWRHRGVSASPEEFHRLLWQGVATQFAVCTPEDPTIRGLVTLYDADMRNQHASFAILSTGGRGQGAAVMEAVFLFITYAFDVFPLRKLYAEVLGFNLPAFQSAYGKYLTEEGVLREHEYHDGRWWPKYIFAIHREAWDESGRRRAEQIVAGGVAKE
jgi:RimJ/RimL family protein N-acetyltransferase